MKKELYFIPIFAFCFALYQDAGAQVFGDEDNSERQTEAVYDTKKNTAPGKLSAKPLSNAEKSKVENKTAPIPYAVKAEKNENTAKKEAQPISEIAPVEVKKPLTKDVRQYKIVDGKKVEEEKEAIYFYYKDFKMIRDVGQTACDVRFVLVTRLAEKLSSISMKIVWPGLGTRISYDGVEPGTEYYADYRFYGQGCYTLDKMPNITINRCRLKGRTQRECASLFQLMKWVED